MTRAVSFGVALAASAATVLADVVPAVAPPKPRLLVLTDIGGDPDDQQSMRRLMLYSNEFEIVGLIASATGTPNDNKGDITSPQLIQEIVDEYGQVRNNLALHAPGYPTAAALSSLIKSGNPVRGPGSVGAGKSTAGSNHIIQAVDATPAGRKTSIAIWGGATDLAQALYDVSATRTPAEVQTFVSKMQAYAILDQDAIGGNVVNDGTGYIIRQNYPTLRYIESGGPNNQVFNANFRGMYQNTTQSTNLVPPEQFPLVQTPWVNDNIRQNHGPLGADYPLVSEGVKEGDTPSWFYFLPTGLGDIENPDWGSWGGRFEKADGVNHWFDATDDHFDPNVTNATVERKYTVARWREAYQNDFAARMDWSVQPFNSANHPPVSPISPQQHFALTVTPGSQVTLSGAGWTDPDGDDLSYTWFLYEEVGNYHGPLTLTPVDITDLMFTAPLIGDEAIELHLILAVTDDGGPVAGLPRLTRYNRYVVTVIPEPAAGAALGAAAVPLLRRRR